MTRDDWNAGAAEDQAFIDTTLGVIALSGLIAILLVALAIIGMAVTP